MKDPVEKRIIGLFLLLLVLLISSTVVTVRNIQHARISSDWVNHAHAIISEADAIFSSLSAGEAALRNFLLTGDEGDRAAGREAFAEAIEHLELGKALTRREAKPYEEFGKIEAILARRMDFARAAVNARQQGGIDAAQKVVAADAGEMGEIRARLARLKDQQQTVVRSHDQAHYLQAANTRWAVLAGGVLNALVLLFLVYLIRDDFMMRRRAASALKVVNQKLEATVQERTAELAFANETLVRENLEQLWSNQALDHQLRFHELIINSIDDLVFVISKALNISRINPAVTRRTGFESQDLVARPLHRVLGSDAAEESGVWPGAQRIESCLKSGRDLRDSPGILFCRDGRKTPVTFSVFPLRDGDKIVGGVMTVKVSHLTS